MKDFSRRQFLKQLGAAAGLFLASRSVLSLPKFVFSNESEAFEMLVVGDSHISGQGLQQKNKFYYLVKEWLQNEVFGENRKVNLKVKAHSGSRIELHKD
ncbi:MAG: twin-arginine translocation signal domain-containing protein, partial [Acidobacteriota bacterium]|nr:twin-arginine translocation signal domain-containing protein [Acidobacteriota bacterium]